MGLWGRIKKGAARLVGRGRPKEEAPAPTPAPEAPPTPPAPKPEAPAPAAPGEAPPTGPPGAPPERPKREEYPSSLPASVAGTWRVSTSTWKGVISSTLSGGDVERFLDAMDAGNEAEAIKVLAEAYDTGGFDMAERIDFDESDWGSVSF